MLDIYTVSLFGHREVPYDPPMIEQLEETIRNLLKNHQYVSFQVGREGEFDRLAASVIRRVRKEVGEHTSELVWVMPYLKQEYAKHPEDYESYYTYIEICEESELAHYKAAIGIRNQVMINHSDLVIAYVRRQTGGVASALRYAQKQNIPIITL